MELEQQIEKLINQLDIKEYIRMVILFGSQARGDYNKYSDIAIAILLDDQLIMNSNSLEIRSELISIFSSSLGKKCDIVLINQASPLLKFQIIKYGKLLYCSDEQRYNSFFSAVLNEYFDFKYYQDFHHNLMLNRIKKSGEIPKR